MWGSLFLPKIMANYQLCYGQYVANDPCFPFCSLPDSSGCDYTPMADIGGSNPFGLTQPYTVIYGDDPLTGNYSKSTYTPVIDPYQTQIPTINFEGNNDSDIWGFGGSVENPFLENSNGDFRQSIGQYNFQIVPTFDNTDFFNENAPTKMKWRVFE